jgi:hypothetical protein
MTIPIAPQPTMIAVSEGRSSFSLVLGGGGTTVASATGALGTGSNEYVSFTAIV